MSDELGFDLYMARPAEWARGTPESLADWYRDVAQQTRVMFVGDVPLRTCELVEDEPNLLAFKEDIDLAYAHEVLMRWGDRWPMTGGGGMKRHHLLWPHGCRSWLDVFVRSYPEPAMTYWDAVQRGDNATAWATIERSELAIGPLVAACRAGGNGFFASMGEAHGVSPALAAFTCAESHRRGDRRSARGAAGAESGLMPVAAGLHPTRS